MEASELKDLVDRQSNLKEQITKLQNELNETTKKIDLIKIKKLREEFFTSAEADKADAKADDDDGYETKYLINIKTLFGANDIKDTPAELRTKFKLTIANVMYHYGVKNLTISQVKDHTYEISFIECEIGDSEYVDNFHIPDVEGNMPKYLDENDFTEIDHKDGCSGVKIVRDIHSYYAILK